MSEDNALYCSTIHRQIHFLSKVEIIISHSFRKKMTIGKEIN